MAGNEPCRWILLCLRLCGRDVGLFQLLLQFLRTGTVLFDRNAQRLLGNGEVLFPIVERQRKNISSVFVLEKIKPVDGIFSTQIRAYSKNQVISARVMPT